MITTSEVKEYLYIPNEVVNDDGIIQRFIDVAYIYLRGAVDEFDNYYETNLDFMKQADLFALLYVSELYNNRNQYTEPGQPSYVTCSLLLQLQTYYGGKKHE